MSEYFKAHCPNCGGGIEFEKDHAGETIQCPHCSRDTLLSAPQPTRSPKSHSVFYYVFWGVLSLIGTLIILWMAATAAGIGLMAYIFSGPNEPANPPLIVSGPIEDSYDSYITNHLQLYDFSATYVESVLDGNIPGVTFKIKNEGDRTLSKIAVTVYFEDKSGKAIWEERYLPVFKDSYRNSAVLKPDYIWQNERGTFFPAKKVPSEWVQGNAYAEITEIEFD